MSTDHVTVREMHEQLGKVHERIDSVDSKLDAQALDSERRFGKVYLLIVGTGLFNTTIGALLGTGKVQPSDVTAFVQTLPI